MHRIDVLRQQCHRPLDRRRDIGGDVDAAPTRGPAIDAVYATGLVEPLGGLLGVIASSVAGPALPLALAFAAGAMLWVVSHELIPASHQPGREAAGTAGLAAGFALMTALAAVF